MVNEELISEYTGTSFSVAKVDGVSTLTFTEGNAIENKEHYGKAFMGQGVDSDSETPTSREHFRLFENIPNYTNVLVLGLGLGTLPQYIKDNKDFVQVIDVVDNNQELIDYVNYLSSSINIIKADAYTYVPNKKYDLIIADLFWHFEITGQNITDLENHYMDHINYNGRIYFPIVPKTTIKNA